GEEDGRTRRQHRLRSAARPAGRGHEEVRPPAGGKRRGAAGRGRPPMSYCDVAPGHPFHGPYHESEYGFPLRDDDALFERLVLEINQAGLSWLTILKKRAAFREAYDWFDIGRVARYGKRERARLLRDAGIIRN